MDRNEMIKTLQTGGKWDVVIIGGGATGLGTAVDAASRGYKTLLLEQSDFSKGTSSRSTKLVHGGVRYLQQGDVSLVFEALRERGLMVQNAPHLVRDLSFVIPNYEWWGGPFYTIGLKVYDTMAGKLGLGPSLNLSKEEAIAAIPTVEQEGLRGGVVYQDGQFDDSRFAISLALTATDFGATVINYMKVVSILKENDIVCGVEVIDGETGKKYTVKSKSVVNATGVFGDGIMMMDNPEKRKMIQPSQGVHIVLDKRFLPGEDAIMIPHTSDGRVLFAVPWHGHVVVGTTDTLVDSPELEPRALEEEVDFILETASKYLTYEVTRADVLSVFAGLRPLAAPEDDSKATKEISRHHKILISISGLITITGGKWTTYRKMAEDTVDHVVLVGGLDERKSITENLMIHSYKRNVDYNDPLSVYGTDSTAVQSIGNEKEEYSGFLSEKLGLRKSQVIWGVREEMARNIEDILARRTRALFLDARESIRVAEVTANLMAMELGESESWVIKQVNAYKELAAGYYLD